MPEGFPSEVEEWPGFRGWGPSLLDHLDLFLGSWRLCYLQFTVGGALE